MGLPVPETKRVQNFKISKSVSQCVPRSFSGHGRGLDLEVRLVIHGKLVTLGKLNFRFNTVVEDNRIMLSKAAYDRLMDTDRV